VTRRSETIRFNDDDLGYLAWIAAHPEGFVLNVRCPPDDHWVVLHRANCKSISNNSYEPNALTGRKHHKICASNEADVNLLPKVKGGAMARAFFRRCSLCRPWTWETLDNGHASSHSEIEARVTEPIGNC
jgi:hypothetical protein